MCYQIVIIQKILKYRHNNIKLFSPVHSNNCLELISSIKLTKKLSDDELIIYVKNLFNNNCYDCCKQITNQIKRTNSCLFFCNDNTDDIIINKRMTDESILKIISTRYPNNCNKCNEKIIHKTKEKYHCLLYCSTNPKQFKLTNKLSNKQLLLMIISKGDVISIKNYESHIGAVNTSLNTGGSAISMSCLFMGYLLVDKK